MCVFTTSDRLSIILLIKRFFGVFTDKFSLNNRDIQTVFALLLSASLPMISRMTARSLFIASLLLQKLPGKYLLQRHRVNTPHGIDETGFQRYQYILEASGWYPVECWQLYRTRLAQDCLCHTLVGSEMYTHKH